jgi:GT2 family glycosyltransferase
LHNRFEDVDFCLRAKHEGLRVVYTPACKMVREAPSWEATLEQDPINRIRFYSRWSGSLWQDDAVYLQEDGLTHDALSALYRELAGRLAHGAQELAL